MLESKGLLKNRPGDEMKEIRKKFLSVVVLGGLSMIMNREIFAIQKSYVKEVTKVYTNMIPMDIPVNLETTTGQPKYLDYVYIKSVDAPLRIDASTTAKIIKKYPFNTKFQLLEKVVSKAGTEWYKVRNEDGNVGFISYRLVTLREFRFNKMMEKIDYLENFVNREIGEGKEIVATNTYVPNPYNTNLKWERDKYGTTLDQNGVGVYKGERIFIPDRSLVAIESETKDKALVKVASLKESPLEVDKKILTEYPKFDPNFRKVIVIDIKNQNQGAFEKKDGQWELISYAYNKTGMESQVGFDTPRGYFLVPMAKYEMGYRNEQGKNQGYAKYAIRFSGGGYIHGTPINFEEDINREFFMEQKNGILGTVPGTRKCIRNVEPHAEFLFNWVTGGKVNPRSNEQRPDENVLFIIF
ncbi:L,D-transpeptidase family protein [Cetobacterium ceti]